MRRRRFLLSGFPAVLPGLAGSEPTEAYLEKTIPRLMEETVVPGVSIALIRNAKLHWRKGFGVRDAETRQRVDTNTVFEAASMSKPAFAYVVMKLCETGVLDLDTPLTRYTPERILQGDPRLEQITARHVLSHTSGLQDWRSRSEPLRIHFDPGERWLYSGEGFHYLQSVVTRLTGHVNPKQCGRYEADFEVCATDMGEYMKARLLAPFGMKSSGYVWNAGLGKLMARAHDAKGKPLELRKSTAVDVARYGSAGALLTTPTDYSKFLVEVIDAKRPDAFRLGQESLREMLRLQVKVNEEYAISWALGWKIAQTKAGPVVSHGGDNLGFHCVGGASLRKKSGFVVMTNGEGGVEFLKKLAPALDQLL